MVEVILKVLLLQYAAVILGVKIMDFHTGPLPCLLFCSCRQWRHNCPWAAIWHLCARIWFEV